MFWVVIVTITYIIVKVLMVDGDVLMEGPNISQFLGIAAIFGL